MKKTYTTQQYLQGLKSETCRSRQEQITVEMTPYAAYDQSTDFLVADGRTQPVFYGGQAQYILLRKKDMDTGDAWQVFPYFRRKYQEADLVIHGIQKRYGELKRHLSQSLRVARMVLCLFAAVGTTPMNALWVLIWIREIQLELTDLSHCLKQDLQDEYKRLREDKGISFCRSGLMYAVMLRCALVLNTPENIRMILPEIRDTYLLKNGLPLFSSNLSACMGPRCGTNVLVHNAICIIGADEVIARLTLDCGRYMDFDTMTGQRMGTNSQYNTYNAKVHPLTQVIAEYKYRIRSITFYEKQTGPTTQALAELQRGFIMAKAFGSDLYCTLPGEQYKLQMRSLLRPLEEIGKEEIAQAAALSYATIVDRVVDTFFVPLIRTLSREYGVPVNMATRGSRLERSLAEIETYVFKRFGELWQEADSPVFRQKVRSHVTRSLTNDQAARHRIDAPFMYILYHLAVPFLAFGPDALTGGKKVIKLETKGMAEISSTMAARRLARDLELMPEMAMLTQPYVPTPHGDRMLYLSSCRDKVFLNRPDSWHHLSDSEAFTQLRYLDVSPGLLRQIAANRKKGAASLLGETLSALYNEVFANANGARKIVNIA